MAKTATYTHAYADSNGFLTLLSDGERLTGAYALGPEAGEWLQQATLAIRARVPLDVLRDTIQPFPTFSEIYVAALKTLHGEITRSVSYAGPATPIKLPSGSVNWPITRSRPGARSGPTRRAPPRPSAFRSAASTSGTPT